VAIVGAAALLLIAAVIAATVVLYMLFIAGVRDHLTELNSLAEVQESVRRVFAGVLLLLLGLELLETLKLYFRHHTVKTETILIVAMIAVGRHIIQIDFEHTPGTVLAGTATLMLALSGSYVLVRWSSLKHALPNTSSSDQR